MLNMTNHKAFESMYEELCNLQTPILTVEDLMEDLGDGRNRLCHHIVVPNMENRTLDFVFESISLESDSLSKIVVWDMSLEEMLIFYSKLVKNDQGAELKFTSV